MTKAVLNREFCFIKAVLLLCEHGHFKKKSKMVFLTPPPILLGLIETSNLSLNSYKSNYKETNNLSFSVHFMHFLSNFRCFNTARCMCERTSQKGELF